MAIAALALLAGCAIYASAPEPRAPPPEHAGISQLSVGGRLVWVTCNPCNAPTLKEPAVTDGRSASAGWVDAIPVPQPLPDVATAHAPPVTAAADTAMSVEHEAVVGFRSDSHVLDKPALDALTGSLRAARAVESVAIAGYTDNRGRKAYNDWLADARVRAVRDWLIEHDVPAAHIETDKSNGLCCYIASNETPAGRARNRRVVVTIQAAAPAEVITRTEVSQRD